ncbi:MAG: sel1 repeat family protein, partial [Synergistaceae bacterium]|nr:sel1 repeat family protein [Synergistaceae bacterium]
GGNLMRKIITAVIILILSSSPLHAEYDPQHTMLALNMAIVSVQRILTAQSRPVLEQEYQNIINNLSLGNIESDTEMTALYRDLMTVITSKRIRTEDSRRLLAYYDTAEKRLIAHALSSIRTQEAIRNSARSEAANAQQDISRINSEQNTVIAGWIGNMAVSCVSSFFGGVFGSNNLLENTVNAYDSYQRLESMRLRSERDVQRAKSQAEIAESRISGLREEMKSDSAMLKEELKNSQWLLDRQEIAECDSLQQRLLTASWNLLRKYSLPDSYRLTQNILSNYYKALNEDNPAKKLRMLKVLEDDFSVYPPYWYYRAKSAEEAGNDSEASESFAKFAQVWRPVLRKDPYKVEAEKFRVRKLAAEGAKEHSREILEALDVIRSNTPKDDWANNLFAGVAFFVMGDKEQGVECLEINIDFDYEHEISGALLEQMRKGDLESSSAQEAVRNLRLGELLKGMSEETKVTASALADFFDGVSNARAELERLSKTENNPAIFHALRIAEQMRGNSQDYSRVMEYVKAHDGLRDKINGSYSAVMPVVIGCVSADSVSAKIFMADSLMFGWGIEQDVKKAEEIFTELAGKGNAYAQFVIVQRHIAGQEYEPLKKKDSPQELEFLYKEGYRYLGQNDAKAAEYFTIAAEGGHAEAQRMLGSCYRFGLGVSVDLEKARYWYQQAANQGDQAARRALNEPDMRYLR